ncbi:MAG: hypothetical protein Q9223_003897 [Gallowayella weberi]
MDKAITQALISLIPEWNHALPPELLELAASLLAQSRNKASSLKAEEEIARTYACAHIACERLKRGVGLPKIQPRPPCPPKVYQKLYRHLNSALAEGTRMNTRVSKSHEAVTPTKALPVTPRKPVRTSPRIQYSGRQERKRETTILEEVPSWGMKAIRGLCKRLGAPAAPPHVFAGVSSILTMPRPFEQSVEVEEMEVLRSMSVEALIITVYVVVRTRLSGVHTDPKAYSAQKDQAWTVMSELRGHKDSPDALKSTDVDKWMREIGSGRWTELDWFANVKEGAGLGIDDPQVEHVHDSDDSNVDGDETLVHGKRNAGGLVAEKPYLQPGLGTMMQARVDYLSDEKRADYKLWKKSILARIERMETANQANG